MIKDLNEVHLIGTILYDIELKTSSKGTKWLSNKVVTNYYVKKEDGTESKPTYHSINAFGKVAEEIKANFQKGSRIDLSGCLSYTSYVKDNVTKWATNITVHSIKAVEEENKTSTPNKPIETPPVKVKEVEETQNEEDLPPF